LDALLMKLTSSVMPDLAIRRGPDSAHLVIEITLASRGVGTTTQDRQHYFGTASGRPDSGSLFVLIAWIEISRSDGSSKAGRDDLVATSANF